MTSSEGTVASHRGRIVASSRTSRLRGGDVRRANARASRARARGHARRGRRGETRRQHRRRARASGRDDSTSRRDETRRRREGHRSDYFNYYFKCFKYEYYTPYTAWSRPIHRPCESNTTSSVPVDTIYYVQCSKVLLIVLSVVPLINRGRVPAGGVARAEGQHSSTSPPDDRVPRLGAVGRMRARFRTGARPWRRVRVGRTRATNGRVG